MTETTAMAKVWNFKQELVFLFGQPVAENPTQYMIENAFRHHRLDWRYINLEVAAEQLAEAVRAIRVLGFRGGNVTIPHKVVIGRHLDRIGPSASLMGAVNCVVRRGEELVGENTDGRGFLQSLRDVAEPAGMTVVILGAGGAARAIGVELALAGARKITIVNRTPERGLELADHLRTRAGVDAEFETWRGDYRVASGTDVVINATSIGLFPDVGARLPLDLTTLRPPMVVADVIPNPPRTRLVQDATMRGCKVIDGLGMLVNQGVIGFQYWTGIAPDPAVMRNALVEVFGA